MQYSANNNKNMQFIESEVSKILQIIMKNSIMLLKQPIYSK